MDFELSDSDKVTFAYEVEMNVDRLEEIAKGLTQARLMAQPVEQYSSVEKEFTRADAYSIQEKGIAARCAVGETFIGMKMGLTSEAKRKQMSLDSPLYGELTDKMQIANGGEFSLENSIHPKIEPEIAFFISKELSGKITKQDVLDSCSGISAALEILDSRYTQFKYFSMEDVVSDNSSSSHFILGDILTDFSELDLTNLKMVMKVNGQVVQEGSSKAISGDPIVSVMQLAELMQTRGRSIPAGSVVLAGAATAAAQLEPSTSITLDVDGLSYVRVEVTK